MQREKKFPNSQGDKREKYYKIVRGDKRIQRSVLKGTSSYRRALEWEPVITAQVKKTARQAGMDMAGVDCRIKSRISYLKKILRKYSLTGRLYEVKDILRYTYIASAQELSKKVIKVIEIYEYSGYNTVEIKNYWLDGQNPYNGINTKLRSPKGQAFELQYHTPESFEIKNGKMHDLYERQRLIKEVSSRDYIELGDQMFELSDSMEIPIGIEKVKDHE